MLRLIVEKEIKEILSSTKFAITFAVCSLLLLLTFYVGARNYQFSQKRYEAAVRENLQQLDGMTDWNQVNNFRIFLPPKPLASLVSGISNDIGRTADVRGGSDNSAYDSFFGNDPVYAVFRFLDLDFVFQVLLSLFAILFAFDAVTGEKERCTLRLNFSNPLPRKTFILGKLLGFMAGFIVPLIIPLLLGYFLMQFMGIGLSGTEQLRLLLILLTGILYLSVFLLLAIFFSTKNTQSSTAFLYAVGVWVLAVMIFPRLSVAASEMFVTVPPLEQINAKKARLSAQLWEEDRVAMTNFKNTPTTDMQAIMKEFSSFMDTQSQNRENKMQDLNNRLFEERENMQGIQQTAAFTLGSLSPATSFSLAVSQLAGTSLALETHFRDASKAYKNVFNEFFFEKTGRRMSGGMRIQISTGDEEKKKPINPAEMPVFVYNEPQLAEMLPGVLIKMAVLIAMGVLLFGAAYYSFTKYDLR